MLLSRLHIKMVDNSISFDLDGRIPRLNEYNKHDDDSK